MSLSGNKLEISRLKGVAGGGSIDAHGFLIYGSQPRFNFDMQAKSVRIRPSGIRSVLDAQLQLNGTTQSSELSGQVLVDRLSFQQGFDLASLSDQFSGGPGAPTTSPFENKMKINVSVQSSQNLNLASSQVSMEGSANLNVTGTAANPVILGRIALTRGEVFFLGKRFEIQNGTIVFTNPVRTEPVLNVFVNTTVEQYNITINFAGPVDRLKMNYTSDPALSQADIINLLAFGRTAAEKASNAPAPASVGAENVLAQGATGQLAKGVQSLTGISQLTIDPLAGNNQNPGAQLAIQQRVSGSLLLTFSTDVTSTQSQSVQLQYQPKRNVTISILRDEYGGYGFDVKFHKVF
jgi:translocation and assembly module TamB